MTSSLEEKKELFTLKSLEDQLVTALQKGDSRDLSKRLFKKCVIGKEVQDKFSSLDHVHLKEELKVRYLVQHIYNAVKDNKLVYHSFVDVLTEVDEGVVSELNKELHQHELSEVLEDSQVGTSEALVGSKRPRASIREVIIRSEVGCTRNSIKTALKSNLVALPDIVSGLEEKLTNEVQRNVHKKQCLGFEHLSQKYHSGDITITRGKSALLCYQVSSFQVSYEWKKDMQPLPEGDVYSGTHSPVLFIDGEGQDTEGDYECVVIKDGQCQCSEANLTFLSIPESFKIYFSSVYSVKKEIPKDSWPPVNADKFINLALIKNNKKLRQDNSYSVLGDMDDIIADKVKVEFENEFGQYESSSLILLEGRPGSGKTTLMHKISRDWSLGKSILNRAEIVILVPIRLFVLDNQDIALSNILKRYVINKDERKELLLHIQKGNGKGICFLIDGLDEYEYHNNLRTFIMKLIIKEVLPLSMVVVASRPVGTALVRNYCTRRIEVLGFQRHQISEYILRYFHEENQKGLDLLSYLKSHVNVYRLCYLPVHASMICFLYDNQGDKIQTESKIYEAFALLSVVRKIEQNHHTKSLNSLPGDQQIYFNNICELAFDMIVQSNQVMLQSKTNIFLTPPGSDKSSLGLVTIDSIADTFGMEDLYTFLHLTFQEYLAAFHLSQLDSESDVIRKTKGLKVNLCMVWKFYSGIVQFDKDSLILKSLMSDSKTDMLYKVQCAFESQQQIACDMLLELREEPNSLCFSNNNFKTTDFLAISYVIETSHNPVTKLSFKKCRLDLEGVDLFLDKVSTEKLDNIRYIGLYSNCTVSEFKLYFKILCKIQHSIETLELKSVNIYRHGIVKLFNDIVFSNLCTLKISDNSSRDKLPVAGKAAIAECLKSCTNLQTLILCYNKLGSDGATALKYGLKSCTNLQTLKLRCNNKSSCGATALAKDLESCTNLQTLDLHFNDIGSDSAKALAESLKSCTHLQTLNLDNNNIGSDGAEALAEGLKSCTNLQTLILCYNNIGSDGVTALAEGLKSCTNLQTLDLTRNNVGSDGATALAEGLKSHTNLQTLDLHFNDIGSDGATALAEGLKSCTNLQTLDLQFNNIGSDGATALAEGLKSCTNLQTLNLQTNNIGSDGATAVAEGLKSCTNLQTLNLQTNNIGSDGATALAEVAEGLKSCTNLQTLDLFSNNVGSDGAEALAEGLKSCTNLQTLNLHSNNIGSDGATALAEGLKSCTNLQTLNLYSNNIGSDGATALAEGLKSCTNLQTLCLTSNNIGSDGAIALAECLKSCTNLQKLHLVFKCMGSDGAIALAEGLKSCTNLQTLDLGYNNIGSDGAIALAEGLKSCTNLQRLRLFSNNLGSDGAIALKGLKSCTNLQRLDLAAII